VQDILLDYVTFEACAETILAMEAKGTLIFCLKLVLPHVLGEPVSHENGTLVKAAVNKDRERMLRTGEPSCRTRIVGRAARAGALSLPLVRPRFAPSPAFCALLLSNCMSLLGSRLVGHLVLGSVRAVRSSG
jgi:hypothetical protein